MAILAMAVLIFGKLIHLGQECGECCSSSHCSLDTLAPERSERPCPFGCEHHSHTTPTEPSDGETPESHDEHNCAICSVLSHVTDCPELAGLPAESELVGVADSSNETIEVADLLFPVHPRGPPSIG